MKEKVRLDKLHEFCNLFFGGLGEVGEDKGIANNKVLQHDDEEQSSVCCYRCKKKLTYNNNTYSKFIQENPKDRIKEIKTIFSQLLIYEINTHVKCICSECSSKNVNEMEIVVKDYLNNKYTFVGNLYDNYMWSELVEFILALIPLYEIYSRSWETLNRLQGNFCKSKRAKKIDLAAERRKEEWDDSIASIIQRIKDNTVGSSMVTKDGTIILADSESEQPDSGDILKVPPTFFG